MPAVTQVNSIRPRYTNNRSGQSSRDDEANIDSEATGIAAVELLGVTGDSRCQKELPRKLGSPPGDLYAEHA